MAKGTKGAFRAGKVLSPDAKWTGEEPEWTGWEKWDVEKFFKTRARMLNFYGYYLTQIDLKPAVLEYMKTHKYSKADIDLIKNATPTIIPTTVGKLVRSIQRGMPSLHPQAQEHFDRLQFHPDPDRQPVARDDDDYIKHEINQALLFLRSEETKSKSVDGPVASKAPTPNPRERLRQKVEKEVISKLEIMLDDWIEAKDAAKVEPLALTSYIRDGGIPGAGCVFITAWLEKQLEEYQGALNKTCPQLVEGYVYLSKPSLKNRVANLEGMLLEVSKFSKVAKTMRKPRIKKVKDASKQVSRLKYQTNSKEYGIDSINPERIPTAQRLYVFNTKYRTLSVYYASGNTGFEIKGTSIKGFADDLSYTTTLRKPKEVLDVITSSTNKQIDKALDAMKCKKRKCNGRINPQTVIVRVFENRI